MATVTTLGSQASWALSDSDVPGGVWRLSLNDSCWQAIFRVTQTWENQAELYYHPFKNCASFVFVDFTGNMVATASMA